ncbi:hypothetical protein AN641_01420 [Candidatus Epulonipiscioides gigas]|nr:hypothetical protein AN641_01420 [Epulopiscium sp. SCG-C07WGA-EpuloA2]
MRIRGKFTKEGDVKFVGHLDTMRMFQRAVKVAKIPVAYSEGFNPHLKVYFAMPLPVGVESIGEYIEIKTKIDVSPVQVKETLNNILPKGIRLVDCFVVEENAATLMSKVDMALYEIVLNIENPEKIIKVLEQPSIIITKRNKKKKFVEQDIKSFILEYALNQNNEQIILSTKLKAGSKENLSPELLLEAIFGEKLDTITYDIKRIELFAEQDEAFIPLKNVDINTLKTMYCA